MSAPRFGWDARNHLLEAGSTLFATRRGRGKAVPAPWKAPSNCAGDKLSHPLGISGLNWVRFSDANAAEIAKSIELKVDMPF